MKKKKNKFWMYSKHAVEYALINPNRNIFEMLVDKKLDTYYSAFLEKNNISKRQVNFKITNKDNILRKIGSLAKYQGIALLVERLALHENSFLKESIRHENLIMIIDQLNDPNNFGSLLRVSYAFGVKNIVVLDRYMPEENGYIASIASGTLDKINIIKVTNLTNTINYLKKKGWWVIGLESKKLENCIVLGKNKTDFKKKVLILGSENKGLRSLVRKNCDVLYRIPTKKNDLDSLNIVQAASIALYQLS